ncbi:late competence development ComFB family protein [Vibrio sp.]|uniref:late competence development ComFB family protein n=1 Tax=Vibrio sp. TaxID=678 RepID=UPI003D14212E
MNINKDVHNYMESLVGQVLARDQYSELTQEQLADLACLALSQLRPVYIRHDIDFLSALSEQRLMVLKQYAETAIESALNMVLDDRRSDRDKEIPIVFTDPRFDDDSELQWFEKPLFSNSHEKEN